MYLEFFNLTQMPFSLTPNTEFYCNLSHHQAALNVLLLSIANGEGFIKITGEVGSGKTLLCRKLLNALPADEYVTAYIPNPDLTPDGLRVAFAHEIGVANEDCLDRNIIIEKIQRRLLVLHEQGKPVILLLDEAQALSEQCLEALRLLTNLETESSKLLQVVLFGQPELDERLNLNSLRQLKQRICFSYFLKPLSLEEIRDYINHRLAIAGHTYGSVFTAKAIKMIYKASHGTPRIINLLCHKSLMAAFGLGTKTVGHKAVLAAINDTECTRPIKTIFNKHFAAIVTVAISCLLITKYVALAGILR